MGKSADRGLSILMCAKNYMVHIMVVVLWNSYLKVNVGSCGHLCRSLGVHLYICEQEDRRRDRAPPAEVVSIIKRSYHMSNVLTAGGASLDIILANSSPQLASRL